MNIQRTNSPDDGYFAEIVMFCHLRVFASHAKIKHVSEAINQFLDYAFCRRRAFARTAGDSGIGHTGDGGSQPDAGNVDVRRYALLSRSDEKQELRRMPIRRIMHVDNFLSGSVQRGFAD